MPHYRTRALLVARGAQPEGADRRLPCRPPPPVTTGGSIVNVAIQTDPIVNAQVASTVDVNAGAPDRGTTPR